MNYFEVVLKEAKKAYKKNEVPVGAVIVKNNKIIAKGRNTRQYHYSVLGHAEINALLKAEKKLKDWRLDDCIMYVTLEPCNLCKTIINESRIKEVYYLIAKDDNSYNSNSKYIQTNDCDSIKNEYNKYFNNFFENLRNKR